MFKVGLTGGIGSGKSSAVKHFEALGVTIIDADQLARSVVAPGQPALTAIADEFGGQALDEAGALNREWMRGKVFADPGARSRLEAITHPLIRQQLLEGMAKPANSTYIIVDIPLLVEKGYQDLFDAIVVVDCEPEQQLQRVRQRDGSDDALIRGIMKAQASRAKRLESATHVLDNSATLENLYQQIDRLHGELVRLAASSHN